MDLNYSTHRTNDTLTLVLHGELDIASADTLADVLRRAIDTPGITRVDVDLHEVTFLDSTAINTLITGLNAANEAGRQFHISRPRGIVHRVLDVAGVLSALLKPR